MLSGTSALSVVIVGVVVVVAVIAAQDMTTGLNVFSPVSSRIPLVGADGASAPARRMAYSCFLGHALPHLPPPLSPPFPLGDESVRDLEGISQSPPPVWYMPHMFLSCIADSPLLAPSLSPRTCIDSISNLTFPGRQDCKL